MSFIQYLLFAIDLSSFLLIFFKECSEFSLKNQINKQGTVKRRRDGRMNNGWS
jgi:hypothetical protein